ncbi:MAG: hypothetical protein COB66_04855 [Coxiella sp. (in: Bacteria)]|nr:MAG: hypothetical protein COB66_04855 [Coxiella sp. (in: g-proteobacteria)]
MYTSSWQISKAFLKSAITFLRNNKDLLWLPAATLVFYGLSVFVEFNYLFAESLNLAKNITPTALTVSLTIMVLLLLVITNLLSCTFYVCTLHRLQNKPCTIGQGLNESKRFILKMLAWSSIKLVMDIIFRAVASLGRFGRIVEIFMQVSWGILNLFVLPIMIMQNVGPITALKRSGAMVKKNWRKNFSISFLLSLVTIAFVVIGYFLMNSMQVSPFAYSTRTVYLLGTLVTIWFLLFSLVMRPLLQISNAALYLFNSDQKEIAYFDNAALQNAFVERRRRFF